MRRLAGWLLVVPLAIGLAGCKSAPSPQMVAWELEDRIEGAEFEKEFAFSLGRVSMGLAKSIVNLGLDESDPELEALRAVRRMALAIYRVESLPSLDSLEGIRGLDEGLARSGWFRVLYAREEDSGTWVYARGNPSGALSNVYIVALDPEELVIVSLQGSLDRMLAAVLADDPELLIGLAG